MRTQLQIPAANACAIPQGAVTIGPDGKLWVEDLSEGLGSLTLDPSNLKLSRAQRASLRSGLARSIQQLRHAEHAKKLVADDPLLGA